MIEDGKKFTFYRKSSFGVSTWTIWHEGAIIYYASAVAEGGAERVNMEQVIVNQSGRAIEAQIELQMRSRLSRMLDKGYKAGRDEALAGATNQLGLVNPMLAHPIDKVSVPPFERAHVQIKFDGHRCLITRFEGKIFAYSRKGRPILTIPHILERLDPILPEAVTFDGELYIHGLPLQTISSYIKRGQANSRDLAYHIYDIVEAEPFAERWAYARSLILPIQDECVHCVATDEVDSLESAWVHFRRSRREGYEGSMLRLSLRGYEDGKRSDQLLKLKERDDEDFRVVDVKAGKHSIGILILKLNDREATFDCTAPGSVIQKQSILANKELYIGRKVEVLFAHKTKDGVPFHGVALRFKEEL